jgi:hypothetical protein
MTERRRAEVAQQTKGGARRKVEGTAKGSTWRSAEGATAVDSGGQRTAADRGRGGAVRPPSAWRRGWQRREEADVRVRGCGGAEMGSADQWIGLGTRGREARD